MLRVQVLLFTQLLITSNFLKKKELSLKTKVIFLKKLKKLNNAHFFLKNIVELLVELKKNNVTLLLKSYFKKYIYINILRSFFFFKFNLNNILYIIINNKKKQVFLNILNNFKKNKNFLSSGICLSLLGQKIKSMRRSTKGFLVLINFLKKILIKNKAFLFNFNIISSKKFSLILFKEINLFLKNIKKTNVCFFWELKLSSGNNLKKVRRIKRRLKKRILKHEIGTNI